MAGHGNLLTVEVAGKQSKAAALTGSMTEACPKELGESELLVGQRESGGPALVEHLLQRLS